MPATKPSRPVPRTRLITRNVDGKDDADIPRAMDDHATAISRIEARVKARSALRADLVIGSNTLIHQLGKKPTGATVTPSVATLAFAWAMTAATDKQVTIAVVGSDMPDAIVEVF